MLLQSGIRQVERQGCVLMTKVVSAATVRHSTGRKMDTSSCDKSGQCCDSQALDKKIDVNDDNTVIFFTSCKV